MLRFQFRLPELERLPVERRSSIMEEFNRSTETVALQKRLGALPARIAAVMAMVVIAVMSSLFDMGTWPCMLAGILCFGVGIPVGLALQFVVLKRSLRVHLRKYADDVD